MLSTTGYRVSGLGYSVKPKFSISRNLLQTQHQNNSPPSIKNEKVLKLKLINGLGCFFSSGFVEARI